MANNNQYNQALFQMLQQQQQNNQDWRKSVSFESRQELSQKLAMAITQLIHSTGTGDPDGKMQEFGRMFEKRAFEQLSSWAEYQRTILNKIKELGISFGALML